MPASPATSLHLETPNRPLDASIMVLPLFLLGFLLARFAAPIFALLPACAFRAAFGFPCPGCGATRAGLALAQGELLAALTYHPLFVVGIGVLSLWSAMGWLEKLSGKEIRQAVAGKIQKKFLKRLRWLAISAMVLNWLYLIISG
jgi:hypothetical protein